jgi:hypothetical protein
MCRAAALSDDSHAVALAEWIATERESVPAESPAEQLPFEPERGTYRATG